MTSTRLLLGGALLAAAAAAPAASADPICVGPKGPTTQPMRACVYPFATLDGGLVSGGLLVGCEFGTLACAIDPVYVGPTGLGPDGVYVNGNRVGVDVTDPCSTPYFVCP